MAQAFPRSNVVGTRPTCTEAHEHDDSTWFMFIHLAPLQEIYSVATPAQQQRYKSVLTHFHYL